MLRAIGRRLTNSEIAAELVVSVRTVESHVASLRRKLGEVDRVGLIAVAASRARSETALPPTAPLIGRDDVLADVGARLAADRVVTLVGPAGVGKSRLAWEVARRFDGEAHVVDLTDVSSPGVVGEVTGALGLGATGGQDLVGHLRLAISHRDVLVVLDNAERVLGAACEVHRLLASASERTSIVVTSRARTGGPGTVLAVEPLPLPEGSDLAGLRANPSVQLLVDRARAAGRHFEVEGGIAADVGELCRRLDGLPLAIELAAGHLGAMSAGELVAALEERLELVDVTATSPHHSLGAAIGWSWSRLDPVESRVLGAVCCLATPVTLEELREILSDVGSPSPIRGPDVTAAVLKLCDQSLLRSLRTPRGPTAFAALETVRLFVRARSDQVATTHDRGAHARHHLARLRASADAALRGQGWSYADTESQRTVLECLRWSSEHDVALAGELLLEIARRYELAPAAPVLHQVVDVVRGRAFPESWSAESLAWTAALVHYVDLEITTRCAEAALARAATPRQRAVAAWAAGLAAGFVGAPDRAMGHLAEASAQFARDDDLLMLGLCDFVAGKISPDDAEAIRRLESGLVRFVESGDAWHANSLRIVLARRAIRWGRRLDDARVWLDECDAFADLGGDALRHDRAHTLAARADLAVREDATDTAALMSRRAAEAFRRHNDLRCLGQSLLLLARCATDPASALAHAQEAVAVTVVQGDPTAQREAVEAVAGYAESDDDQHLRDRARGALHRLAGRELASEASLHEHEGYAAGPVIVATTGVTA